MAYVNGTLSNNYTGNTDRLDSDLKSSPKGIKADGDILINGGNSVPSASSGSSQPYVTGSASVSACQTVSLADAAGAQLATFTVPEGYTSSGNQGFGGGRPGGGPGGMGDGSVLVTCPGLVSGSSYKLGVGTSSYSSPLRIFCRRKTIR